MLRRFRDWVMGWIRTYQIYRSPDLMASTWRAQEQLRSGKAKFITYEEMFDDEDIELAEQGMKEYSESLKRIDKEA